MLIRDQDPASTWTTADAVDSTFISVAEPSPMNDPLLRFR